MAVIASNLLYDWTTHGDPDKHYYVDEPTKIPDGLRTCKCGGHLYVTDRITKWNDDTIRYVCSQCPRISVERVEKHLLGFGIVVSK